MNESSKICIKPVIVEEASDHLIPPMDAELTAEEFVMPDRLQDL